MTRPFDALVGALQYRGVMAGCAGEWPDGRITVFAESYAGAYQAIYHPAPIIGCTIRPEATRLRCVAPGVAMLWALALEVDEHGPTLTSEWVCVRCDGTGEAPESDEEFRKRIEVSFTFRGGPMIRRAAVDCPCDGETKPATVSLAWVVEQLAAQRSPVVTDWPEQWAVDVDAMEANGWGTTWLPSQGPKPARWTVTEDGQRIPVIDTRLLLTDGTWADWDRRRDPTPAWVCRWWQAFREWTTTGRDPDTDVLAGLLADRTEARRKRLRQAEASRAGMPTDSDFDAAAAALGLVRRPDETRAMFQLRVTEEARVPTDAFALVTDPPYGVMALGRSPARITIAGRTFDAQHVEVSETHRTAHVDVILTEADARTLVTSGLGEPVHITSGGDAWTGSLADAQVFRSADRPAMPRVQLRVDQVRRVRRADLRGLNPARTTFARPGDSARGDGLDCDACDGSGTTRIRGINGWSSRTVCAECLGRGRTAEQLQRDREASEAMEDVVRRARITARRLTIDSLRATLLDSPDIEAVDVHENPTSEPDGPIGPHSIAIVYDGAAAEFSVRAVARGILDTGIGVQVYRREAWEVYLLERGGHVLTPDELERVRRDIAGMPGAPDGSD